MRLAAQLSSNSIQSSRSDSCVRCCAARARSWARWQAALITQRVALRRVVDPRPQCPDRLVDLTGEPVPEEVYRPHHFRRHLVGEVLGVPGQYAGEIGPGRYMGRASREQPARRCADRGVRDLSELEQELLDPVPVGSHHRHDVIGELLPVADRRPRASGGRVKGQLSAKLGEQVLGRAGKIRRGLGAARSQRGEAALELRAHLAPLLICKRHEPGLELRGQRLLAGGGGEECTDRAQRSGVPVPVGEAHKRGPCRRELGAPRLGQQTIAQSQFVNCPAGLADLALQR